MTQLLRPIADISAGSWTASSGSALYAMVDEVTASATDYIRSPENPTTQTCELKYGAGTGTHSTCTTRAELQATGADTDFDLELVQGTTVLDSWTESVTTAEGQVIRTHVSSGISITDPTDLRTRQKAKAPDAAYTLVSSYAGYVDADPTPTYYVSSSGGNDAANGFSASTAWATLDKVRTSATLVAGTVVALKRGDTWNEQFNIVGNTGADGNPIIYTAYGSGALPIIDGQDTRTFCVQVYDGTSHVVISNLHLKRAAYDGIKVTGDALDVVLYNILSELNGRDGFGTEADIGLTDQDDMEISRCEAYANGRAGFFAFNVTQGGSVGIHYYNCKATYSGQGEANHGFSGYFANKIHWHGCEAAYTDIDPGTGDPNATSGSEGIGFAYDDESGNGSCTYCYSHHNEGPGIAAGHFASNNEVSYNLVVLNGRDAIVLNGETAGSNNIKINSNTCVANGGNGLNMFSTGASTGAEVKNNIFANNTGWGISRSGNVTSYTVATNLIYGNGSGATTGVTGATGTITTDPLLDGSYVPGVGSPAINAGLTLTNTMGLHSSSAWPLLPAVIVQSGTWEIGAFVYG